MADRRYVIPYYVALAHLGFGDGARALKWLEKACDDRSAYMSNIDADPALDALRGNARFGALLRRVGVGNQ